jgi:hypothetical protein
VKQKKFEPIPPKFESECTRLEPLKEAAKKAKELAKEAAKPKVKKVVNQAVKPKRKRKICSVCRVPGCNIGPMMEY